MSHSESVSPSRGLALHWKVLIALTLGVVAGVAANRWWTPDSWQSLGVGNAVDFLKGKANEANSGAGLSAKAVQFAVLLNEFLGSAFVKGLRLIAVPVVFFSIIGAVAGVGDVRKVGRIGTKTILWFVFTMIISVAIAMAIATIVRPGAFVDAATRATLEAQEAATAAARVKSSHEIGNISGLRYFFEYILSAVPSNPFAALSAGDMLQVITAAVLLGLGLASIPRERAEPALKVAEAVAEAVMAVVGGLMKLAPIAVFCLSSTLISKIGMDALIGTGVFCLCVIGGLAIILFVFQPIMLWMVTPRGAKIGLSGFLRGMGPAITLAFSSSSSSATLPVTIRCTRDGLGVPEDLANFVCPLGSTLNMDGTALYQVISVLFLAQLYGVDLTVSQHLTVGVMAVIVAMGSPGMPGASVVMMAVVLEAVGVPTAGIAIILAVDRVLDMCRTIVNVTGDAVCAVAIASGEGRMPTKLVSG